MIRDMLTRLLRVEEARDSTRNGDFLVSTSGLVFGGEVQGKGNGYPSSAHLRSAVPESGAPAVSL